MDSQTKQNKKWANRKTKQKEELGKPGAEAIPTEVIWEDK